MVNESDWKAMKLQAFDAFARDGKITVHELEQIVNTALADGKFDEQEKAVVIDIISKMTGEDMTDAMWLKVDDLIHKFDLHGDSEAFIEHFVDDPDS